MQTGFKGTIYLRQRLKTAPEQYLLSLCLLVTGLHLNQRQSAGCPKTKVLVLISSGCGLLGSNHKQQAAAEQFFFFQIGLYLGQTTDKLQTAPEQCFSDKGILIHFKAKRNYCLSPVSLVFRQ